MSLTATPALASHAAQECTTWATLWRVTRRDAQVFGFTSHDAPLVFDSITHHAEFGFQPTALAQNPGLAVGNAELQATFWAEAITEPTLRAGIWDGAEVRLALVNWADLTQGALRPMRGWLGEVSFDGFAYTAELRGLQDLLNRPVGRIISPTCDAKLGDARCGVNLAAHTTLATVTSVTSQREFITTLGLADNSLTTGHITWATGPSAGLRADVKSNTAAGALALQLPMELAVSPGDTFTAVAGCNGALSTCKETYTNVVNFRGFPSVPGPDRARRIGGQG